MDADVVIIGAGAAGRSAARELGSAGKKVLLLEARERLGGRICPLPEGEWGYPAQGGAEFVHGDAPLTKALLAEADATLTHPTERWNINDGEFTVNERVSIHNEALEKALGELAEDMTIAEFLRTRFPGEENAALRDFVLRRVEGYDAADPEKVSAKGFYEDVTDMRGSLAQNIREGYGVMIEKLAWDVVERGGEIKTGEEVTTVEVTESGVAVTSTAGAYTAPHVIVTVPPPLLARIKITPGVPEKIAALEDIGYGNVIKILVRFKTKWWTGVRERVFERMFFMFSREEVPTWWTQYPEPHTTLTGWVAGPKALVLQEKSEEEIVAAALTSLSRIFSISEDDLTAELEHAQVFAWGKDPYALGAYSYYTPGSGEAVKTLLQPVRGRLFFAGEALFVGEPAGAVGGTVEAALASGRAAVDAVRKAGHEQ